jgi:hypothetical protein
MKTFWGIDFSLDLNCIRYKFYQKNQGNTKKLAA